MEILLWVVEKVETASDYADGLESLFQDIVYGFRAAFS
jgi:hypothetical protein